MNWHELKDLTYGTISLITVVFPYVARIYSYFGDIFTCDYSIQVMQSIWSHEEILS